MTGLEAIPKISELLARLIKLSKDRQAAALVQQIQEHQLVIQSALLDADRKMAQMESDHAQEIAELQAALKAAQPKNEGDIFVEHRGALFKKKPGDSYHNAVYCPDCKGPMVSLMDEFPFGCNKCKRSVNFAGSELAAIMRELP